MWTAYADNLNQESDVLDCLSWGLCYSYPRWWNEQNYDNAFVSCLNSFRTQKLFLPWWTLEHMFKSVLGSWYVTVDDVELSSLDDHPRI